MSVLNLSAKQLKDAGHTLWQAAAGSGAAGLLFEAVTTHGVNVPGIEQGGYVAAVALAGAALSIVKGVAVNSVGAYKSKSATNADRVAKAEAIAQWVVTEYEAKHAPAVTSVA